MMCRSVGVSCNDEQTPRQQHAETQHSAVRDAGGRVRQLAVLCSGTVRRQHALSPRWTLLP